MDAQLMAIEAQYRAIAYPSNMHQLEPQSGRNREQRTADRNAYRAQCREVDNQFKIKCLEIHGLTDHPKADKVWDMAYEDGHSAGYNEIDIYVARFAELVL